MNCDAQRFLGPAPRIRLRAHVVRGVDRRAVKCRRNRKKRKMLCIVRHNVYYVTKRAESSDTED